jgi:hypothetical protein
LREAWRTVFVLTAGVVLSAGLSAAMAGAATQSMAAIPVAAANCNIKRELLVIGLCLLYSDKFELRSDLSAQVSNLPSKSQRQ